MTSAAKTVGEQLRLAREQARPKLSVREAARRTEGVVSEGWWRAVENGHRSVRAGMTVPTLPSPKVIRAMAQVVDLNPEPLLLEMGLADEAEPPPPDINPGAARRFDALEAKLDRIERAMEKLVEQQTHPAPARPRSGRRA